ncbi:MAG: glycine--tRNA ligase subunit beta [Marinicellaceae bacterium]
MSNILFELGTEELPPKALNNLAKSLFNGVTESLVDANINFDKDQSRWFASPRKLAFMLVDIDKKQADKIIQRKGPAVIAAFDADGNAKPAALGFAKSVGAEVNELQKLKTDKGEWLVFDIKEIGKNTSDLITGFIQNSIKKMPIPKPMRWGSNDFSFIRPVHSMILLMDSEVIDFEMFGIQSSNKSRGHRFHFPDFITIESAETYVKQLLGVRVEVDQITRKENIKKQVLKVAASINGTAKTDESLLDEVTAIVEYPVALLGSFDDDFLQVPSEALVSSMQKHQKYFPVFDQNNVLIPHFIAFANIESKDEVQVVKGFEKVIKPRLADARFFWEKDQKHGLESNFKMLDKMTFEKQLGTLADKCNRIKEIMFNLALNLDLDILHAERSAILLKCDLVTDMVDEFPDLQGIMGGYYAKAQGEDDEVAQAIQEQYKPAFSGDNIPSTPLGQVLSLADKIDTLCGIFAVGKKPTGNKDPFALRRASLGIIRILQEGELNINLYELIEFTINQLGLDTIDRKQVELEVSQFIFQRLKHNYLEQGFSYDVIESVMDLKPGKLTDFHQRILACETFKKDSTATALAAANKRISNILKKSSDKIPEKVILRLLKKDHEKNLLGAIESIKRRFSQDVKNQHYDHAFNYLSSLAVPVDNFFDNVMVNSEDDEVRLNRLAILKQLNKMFRAIANISKLEI